VALGDKSVRFDIEGRNKTTKAFKQVNSSMSKLTAGAAKLGVALAGAFAVGKIGAFGKQTLAAADAIGKFADRAGISTDELQKMRYAFDLAGVGVEAVDKGLLNFGKRLGKAHQGIGALKGGLKGGEEALLDMLMATDSQSEALDVIFKAMGAATTQRRKLAIADAAFGMSGLRMTAAFREGSKVFFQMKNEAAALGVVLDESMIRKAEELNDQMGKVSKVIGAKLMTAFSGLFPVMLNASNAILDFSMRLRGLSSIADKDREALSEMLIDAKGKVITLEAEIASLNEAFTPARVVGQWWLNRDLKAARGNVEHLQKAYDNLTVSIELEKKVAAAPEPSGIKTLMDVIDFYDVFDKKLDDSFTKQLAADKKLAQSAVEKEKSIKLKLEELNFEKELIKERSEGDHQAARMMELRKQVGLELFDGREAEQEQLQEIMIEHEKYNRILEIQNRIVGSAEAIFDRWGDGMLTALQRGEDAFESFKNTALAALFDIGREMTKLMVFDPIKKAAAGPLGRLAGSIGSAIGGSWFGGSSGGGTDFDVQGFATGGPVSGRSPIIVGERGPELFTPSSSGYITPNNQLGGGTSVTLNISTGVQATVRAEVMGMMPIITQTVKSAVAEARQRGGSFSEAMGV